MTTQYTPGPWRVLPEDPDKDYIRIRGACLGARYKVANVLIPSHPGIYAGDSEEARANARLIAAAPDLLEALRGAIPFIGYEGGGDQEAKEKAYSAIEKAIGAAS